MIKRPLKDSEIYRELAQRYAEGKALVGRFLPEYGVCDLLGFVNDTAYRRGDLRDEFRYYFVMAENGEPEYFIMSDAIPIRRECRRVRVLALLFMAEIAKSEGR